MLQPQNRSRAFGRRSVNIRHRNAAYHRDALLPLIVDTSKAAGAIVPPSTDKAQK
jgi:hypothetical protein